ncbi:NEL-type E3 ubiquitin ligase domain-containing protein [Pseudomonas akapageensis]|uniref:NEL-type E3 ubiquitin ligase domain-containing protein n=1 Tax=Pseudomonas akapageensis TaxID=2609961 RepID=UPI001409A9B2|nr:NEL-type E3 ubiquitin ligase domain-containing protein [Pseudomonas akapageensis]
METTSEHGTPQAGEQAEADLYNEQFIRQQMPAWLTRADDQILKVLSKSLRLSQRYQARVVELLRPLQPLESFAGPRLDAALQQAFGNALDRRRDVFVRGREVPKFSETIPVGSPFWTVRYTRQPLLQAALHNFDRSEASAATASKLAMVARDGRRIDEVPAHRFASVCRDLDLGGQYQSHLNGIFSPPATGELTADEAKAKVDALFKNSHRFDLLAEVHLARIKQRIDAQWHRVLQELIALKAEVKYDNMPVTCHRVHLFGVPLTGVIAFQARFLPLGPFAGISNPVLKLVVYIPGDPQGSLMQYDSWAAFEQALKGKLTSADYRRFFARFILRRNLPKFLGELETLKSDARLSLDWPLLSGQPFDALCEQRLMKIKDDARFLAVPTDDIDQRERQAILRQALEIGLDVLGLAALVVPGLGEVVLGVAAAELMGEAFHGLEDWAQGQRHEAFECLTDVLENLAGLAVGAAAVGAAASLVKRSAFFKQLMPVKLADGQVRLWNPDLRPYQWDIELPEASAPSPQGIHTLGDRQFIRIDGKHYAVEREGEHGRWRLRHPTRSDAYSPNLEHDGHGAWRASIENPLQWQQASYAFRRFGHEFGDFSDVEINRILAITGTDVTDLQRLHLENRQPSGALRDCYERFRLDRRIGQFIHNLDQDAAALDESLLQTLRDGLAADDQSALLDEEQAPLVADAESRQRIGRWVRENRGDFFTRCRAASELALGPVESVLSRDFPGLSSTVVRSLVAEASDAERLRLADELRVPLRLAEQARVQLQQVRLNRANEGFYLASVVNPDTDLLLRHFQAQHPDWPEGLATRNALAELACSQRGEAARILGIHERPRVVLPRRQGNGSIGYPLSGRGQASWNVESTGGLVRELYPNYSDADVREFLETYRLSLADVRTVLLRKREELIRLDEVLSRWQSASVSIRQRESRLQVSRMLRQAWRRQTSAIYSPLGRRLGSSLVLDGMRIGRLPELGASIEFEDVNELSLRNMELAEVSPGFLGRFHQLRLLDLSNNNLTVVPEALASLSQLRGLRLRGNRIRLTANTAVPLENLRYIDDLDLGGNPLGRLPDLSQMTHLRQLGMRGTAITEPPEGLWRHPFLETVDLRDNLIERLPDAYFSEPPAFLQRIVLDGNPLPRRTRERIWAYLSLPAMLEGPAVELVDHGEKFWLPLDTRTREQLVRWRNLQREEGSLEFFRLLERLTRTSEARVARAGLTVRVNAVLEAASEKSEWRTDLFALAGNVRSCSDSVISNFSALEVKVLVLRAEDLAVDADAGPALVELARGLFRLDQLEIIAQADIAARAQALVDPVEVNLAYRTRLAARLELPAQPQTMAYGDVAEVSVAQLRHAEKEVRRAEQTDAWPRFLASRDFWGDYLRNRYADQFNTLLSAFYRELETLEQRLESLDEGQYITEAKALKERQKLAEQTLLLRLSRQELERLRAPLDD